MDTVYVVTDHNTNDDMHTVLGVFFDPQAATDAAVRYINDIREMVGEPLVGIDDGLTATEVSSDRYEITDPWMEFTVLEITQTTVS